MRGRAAAIVAAMLVVLCPAAVARAQSPGETPPPIPQDPLATGIPAFSGSPATPEPTTGQTVPQHPFMAPNGRSNIHDDAYMTDTYQQSGPLGIDLQASSALFNRECGSVTFDSQGRIVTICVGLDRPVLAMLEPRTFRVLAEMDLPPRSVGANPFQDFSSGGYFYLDDRDRAVISAANKHILVVGETGGASNPGFVLERDYDSTGAV